MEFKAITRSFYSALSIESWNAKIEEVLSEEEILSAISELNKLLAIVKWWRSFDWEWAKEAIYKII